MSQITPTQILAILAANKAAGNKPGTQAELADAANLSGVVINRWLRGSRDDIKLETAGRMADALGLKVVTADGTALI